VNPVGDALAGLLTNVVFPFLGALLLGLVGVILNKIRQKWGLKISAETQAQIERAALAGVALAEEKAAAAVRTKVDKITGKEKLDMAIAHVLTAVPKVSADQADAAVHAVLGKGYNLGATGDRTVGL